MRSIWTRAIGLTVSGWLVLSAVGCGGGGGSTGTTPTSIPTLQVLDAAAAAAQATSGCPATLRFTGTITHNGGTGLVTYRWELWDGTTGDIQTFSNTGNVVQGVNLRAIVSVDSLAKTVSASGSYWGKIHVLTPLDTTSGPATVTVSCPGL